MVLSKCYLEKFQSLLNYNVSLIETIVEYFPYNELLESTFSLDVLRLILDILGCFSQTIAFFRHQSLVFRVINFYTLRLYSISDLNDSIQLFSPTITNYRKLFATASRLGMRLNITPYILKLVGSLMSKAIGTDFTKDICMLMETLLEGHIVECNEHFGAAITQCWITPMPQECRLRLVYAMICQPNASGNPIIIEAYQFFVQYIPDFDSNMNATALNKVLYICLCIFNQCSKEETLHMLAVNLIKCNSLHTLKNMSLNLEYAKQLLVKQIEALFAAIPWNVNRSLDDEEDISLADAIDNYIDSEESTTTTLDVQLIIAYLEFYYKNCGNLLAYDLNLVLHLIEQHIDLLPTRLPCLKALYMFFALHCTSLMTAEKWNMQKVLLADLQNSTRIEDLLTFHYAQLAWILSEGSWHLKATTLQLWIKHRADIDKIAFFIENANSNALDNVEMLAKLLIASEDVNMQLKIVRMLQQLHDQEIVGNVIINCISDGFINSATISLMLELKPRVPVIPQQSPTVSLLEVCKKRELVRRLITLFTYLFMHEASYSDTCKLKMGSYLYELLRQSARTNSDVFAHTLSSDLPMHLVELLHCENDEMVSLAAKMLCFIINTQQKLNMPIGTCATIRPMYIRLGNMWTQHLLCCILSYSRTNQSVVCIDDYFDFYEFLLDNLCTPHGHIAHKYIRHLIHDNEDLALCDTNLSTIQTHCLDQNVDINFIRYLIDWIALYPRYTFDRVQLPWATLKQFVSKLEMTGFNEIDYSPLKTIVSNYAPIALY